MKHHSKLTRRVTAAVRAMALLALASCGGGGGGDGGGGPVVDQSPDQSFRQAPGGTRTWLTATDLNNARSTPDAPLHNGHFMPVGTSGGAQAGFSGTLRINSFTLFTDDASAASNAVETVFPNIDLQFVSDGGDLIPLERGILVGTNSSVSRLILGPGKVWSEPADNGWSRASFPFQITAPVSNLARNGLATFVYNGSQMSALRIQLVQESIGIASRSNVWATLRATYQPQTFPNRDAVVEAFRQEQAGYLRVAPWSGIAPQLALDTAGFNDNIGDDYISYAGLVKDGVIYLQPCHTRTGDYPYCTQMRAGAFSVTKSMGAAVALFRLAQKYGDGVGSLRIRDYVNVTATHQGWDNVTFLDALNMATGVGINAPTSPVGSGCCMFADENTEFSGRVAAAQGKTNMLAVAFQQNAYTWGPGVEARYDSVHTLILSAAMDAYLKRQEGPNAHLWDMVVNEVLRPIGVAHAPMIHTIESDGSRGIPRLAVGLYPTADDTAKIAQLFHNGGRHGTEQLLSADLTAAAMYRTANQGLRGFANYDNTWGQHRYLMAFHSVPWSDGAACTTRVPSMQGLGGNLVVLLPNGVTGFRYAHANNYNTTPMIRAAASLGPMCPP